MARWSEAIWQGLPRNYGPAFGSGRPNAVTLHHVMGNGNPYNVYLSRGVSAHFWIPKSGKPVQHVDTAYQAWHGVAHNAYSIGVETEGCGPAPHAEALTQSQIDWFARLMAWANKVHKVPLVLSESVYTPGLNYHRCSGGPATACPCDVRVRARAEILRRAKGQAPSKPSAPSAPREPLEEIMSGPVVIDWRNDSDACPLDWGNYFADGKGRLRLSSNGACQVRVDWPNADNRDIDLAYDKWAQGVTIPKNVTACVLRLRRPKGAKDTDPMPKVRVSVALSK